MRLERRSTGSEDPDRVVEVLQDLAGWERWLPGVRESEVVAHTNAVVVALSFVAPRPLLVGIDVTELPDGISFRMVEGDLLSLEGQVTVGEHRDGCVVTWSLSLEFVTTVPGPILSELDRQVLPAWSAALFRAARPGSDQSAD